MEIEFIDELASSSPTPGGGGASAVVGAVASALASMVGELTVGKKRYADVEDEVLGSLGRLAVLRSRLLSLADEDAEAFAPLAAAYGLPSATEGEREEKEAVLSEASVSACMPPLGIMRACLDVLCECDFLAHNGSRLAVSDAGACAILAKGAAQAASLNVYINLKSIASEEVSESLRADADKLVQDVSALADSVYAYVAGELGASLPSESGAAR